MALENHKAFDTTPETGDVLDLGEQTVTSPGFSGLLGTLTTAHTSSTQTANTGEYHIDVYQEATSSTSAEVQFAISYGHQFGSGSVETNDEKPTRAVYNQYSQLLLGDGVSVFSYNSGSTTKTQNHFFVLNYKRERIKDRIDPTTFKFSLNQSTSTLELKSIVNSGVEATLKSGNIYSIVSASATDSTLVYGKLFADLGIVVLAPDLITSYIPGGVATGSVTSGLVMNTKVYAAISSAQALGSVTDMTMRAVEKVKSQVYFIRIRSNEYNEPSNPTFYSGSSILPRFANPLDRISYITTVGLYDNDGDLLAVAKLSQPLLKRRGNEALIKVKLDF